MRTGILYLQLTDYNSAVPMEFIWKLFELFPRLQAKEETRRLKPAARPEQLADPMTLFGRALAREAEKHQLVTNQ